MGKLKRPYDPIQQEYVERELQKLQAEQEMLRASKGMGGPTDKMPTTGFSGQFGPAEFKYGGKKKYAGGGTFNAVTGQWEEDGYPGPYSSEFLKPAGETMDFSANDAATLRAQNRNALFANHESTFNIAPQTVSSVPNPTNDITDVNLDKTYPYAKYAKGTMGQDSKPVVTPKQKFDWGEAGVLGAQLAGDIVGLGYSLKKPNYAKYQRISPSLVNYNQAATDITNSAGLMEQSTAQALRNQGQSSGAYLNNRINLASRLGQQTGAQLAELRMNEANTNVGIKNDAITRNAEIQRAEVETNAKEKDSRMQALVGHLGGIGSKVAGYSKDGKQMKLDKAQFAQLLKYSPDLFRSFDPIQNTDGTITLKQKGTQTT
jgi:hypothetical protein